MCEWLVQNELCGSNKALKKDAGTPIKSEILTINAKDMRKSGLGKDVTNKFCFDIATIKMLHAN
jgi:hypothetical protein